MDTELDIDEDTEFSIEDYSKVAAALWAIHVKHGNDYTVRLVHSILRVLKEVRKEQ
jgi:hypothetical protein